MVDDEFVKTRFRHHAVHIRCKDGRFEVAALGTTMREPLFTGLLFARVETWQLLSAPLENSRLSLVMWRQQQAPHQGAILVRKGRTTEDGRDNEKEAVLSIYCGNDTPAFGVVKGYDRWMFFLHDRTYMDGVSAYGE